MNRKRLTIIIPVYNAANDIHRCLGSLLPQLSPADEVLLIDDGSTDDSMSILRKVEEDNPEIVRVITHENMGAANTRNKGIKEAYGEYVSFMDNDDYVEPDYVNVLMSEIIGSDYDVVECGYDRRTDEDVLFTCKPEGNGEWYKYMCQAPWAKVYKKSFLIENDITFLDYPLNEDVYFTLKCLRFTNKIKLIDYVGYHWYFNNSSVSNTSQKSFSTNIDIVYLMNKLFEAGGYSNELVRFFYTRHMIWYLLFAGRNSSKERFMAEYNKLITWTEEKNLNWEFTWNNKKIQGELLTRRVAIRAFLVLKKLSLIGLFAKCYCKGNN